MKNSVAISGLNRMSEKVWKIKNRYFFLDWDKSGIKKSIELLEKGEYVFNWNMFGKKLGLPKREKWDWNDVMRYFNRDVPVKFEEIQMCFTNSIYKKMEFYEK
jgi:hypothetical protein